MFHVLWGGGIGAGSLSRRQTSGRNAFFWSIFQSAATCSRFSGWRVVRCRRVTSRCHHEFLYSYACVLVMATPHDNEHEVYVRARNLVIYPSASDMYTSSESFRTALFRVHRLRCLLCCSWKEIATICTKYLKTCKLGTRHSWLEIGSFKVSRKSQLHEVFRRDCSKMGVQTAESTI